MPIRYLFKLLAGLICMALISFGINYVYFYAQEKPETEARLTLLPAVQAQTRLLVFAPHCDDEVLGCAAVIHDVIAAGGQVMVVIMTNGDGFTFATEEQFNRVFITSSDYIQSGYTRQRESIEALKLLGVPEQQIIFLGYPDRGLKALWSDYWESSTPYQSRYTGCYYSPYTNSYLPNAPYAGEAVLANINQILQEYRPNLILAPHAADEHPDHAATWAFVTAAFNWNKGNGRLQDASLYTYLVHRGDFPIPHGYKPTASLLPPRPLYQSAHTTWNTYPMTLDNEIIKEQAINQYTSQLRVPIMSSLLNSFIRENELFAKVSIPSIEYGHLDLANLEAWQNTKPFLFNPRGVNPLGALEPRAQLETISSYRKNDLLWMDFHIPGFSKKQNQYYVEIVEFKTIKDTLRRSKRTFYFSKNNSDLPPSNIFRFNDDVLISVAYPSHDVPDYFYIQVLTKDQFGALINHTVWQPVLVNH